MRKSLRNTAQPKKVYRFKLWTRKSYSVFNSLGKLVSIGFLSISLSEKIGAKSSQASKVVSIIQQKEPSPEEPLADSDPAVNAFEGLLPGILVPVVLASAKPHPQGCSQCSRHARPALPFFIAHYSVLLFSLPRYFRFSIFSSFRIDYSDRFQLLIDYIPHFTFIKQNQYCYDT